MVLGWRLSSLWMVIVVCLSLVLSFMMMFCSRLRSVFMLNGVIVVLFCFYWYWCCYCMMSVVGYRLMIFLL